MHCNNIESREVDKWVSDGMFLEERIVYVKRNVKYDDWYNYSLINNDEWWLV